MISGSVRLGGGETLHGPPWRREIVVDVWALLADFAWNWEHHLPIPSHNSSILTHLLADAVDMCFIDFHWFWRHFWPGNQWYLGRKSMVSIDFSLLSLPLAEKFWISELELERFKICLEKLSMRSLRICNSFFAIYIPSKKFLCSKARIFGIFSSGSSERATLEVLHHWGTISNRPIE